MSTPEETTAPVQERHEKIDGLIKEISSRMEDGLLDACLSYAHRGNYPRMSLTGQFEQILKFLKEFQTTVRITVKRGDAKTPVCYYHSEASRDVVIYVPAELESEKQDMREKIFGKLREVAEKVARRMIKIYDREIVADVSWTVREYLHARDTHGSRLLTDPPEIPDALSEMRILDGYSTLTDLLVAREERKKECERKHYVPDGFAVESIDRNRVLDAVESEIVAELAAGSRISEGELQYLDREAVADDIMRDILIRIDVVLIACSHYDPYGDRNPFVRAFNNGDFANITDFAGHEIIHVVILPEFVGKFLRPPSIWSGEQGFGRFDTREEKRKPKRT